MMNKKALIACHSSFIIPHSSFNWRDLHPVETRRAAARGEGDARALDVAAFDRAAQLRPVAPVCAEGEAVALAALRRHAQVNRFRPGRVGARHHSLVLALTPPDRNLAPAEGDAG